VTGDAQTPPTLPGQGPELPTGEAEVVADEPGGLEVLSEAGPLPPGLQALRVRTTVSKAKPAAISLLRMPHPLRPCGSKCGLHGPVTYAAVGGIISQASLVTSPTALAELYLNRVPIQPERQVIYRVTSARP
jgi:hypothetical protein